MCSNESGKNGTLTVPPAMKLPSEIMLQILSFCDHPSVVNMSKIGDNWRECVNSLLDKKKYWKNRCKQEMSPIHLRGLKLQENEVKYMYKWIYLKWIGWKNLRSCPTCQKILDVRKANFCAIHEIAVQQKKISTNWLLENSIIRTPVLKIEYCICDGQVKVELRTTRELQTLVITNMLKDPLFSCVVGHALPANITCFFYYCGIFMIGLQNGFVLFYNVRDWNTFKVFSFDLIIIGMQGHILSIAVQERGPKRIIIFATSKFRYAISWNFKSELQVQL